MTQNFAVPQGPQMAQNYDSLNSQSKFNSLTRNENTISPKHGHLNSQGKDSKFMTFEVDKGKMLGSQHMRTQSPNS